MDCCNVFIAELIGSRMKSQPLEIHCLPQIRPVSWPGPCWIVYVSLSSNTRRGSLSHRGQQLANHIYSCIRAPAVQMCCTTQRKQIHNIKGHLLREVWENPHLAPQKCILVVNQFATPKRCWVVLDHRRKGNLGYHAAFIKTRVRHSKLGIVGQRPAPPTSSFMQLRQCL